MTMNNNNNNSNTNNGFHHFRLFSYLSVSVLSISIMMNFFLVFQHINEQEEGEKTLANQQTLIENQQFLKTILKENEEHEARELNKINFLLHLFNTTGSNITKQNTEKLDQILEIIKSKP